MRELVQTPRKDIDCWGHAI